MADVDVVVFETDPGVLAHVRALLEPRGFRVLGAKTAEEADDALRSSRARNVLCSTETLSANRTWARALRTTRWDVDLIAHADYAIALLDRGARSGQLVSLASESLLLLGSLAEANADEPQITRLASRLAGLTAFRLNLSHGRRDTCRLAAALAALGPNLVQLRLGRPNEPVKSWGVSPGLEAALAVASQLTGPYELTAVLEAIEERFDGGGRARGLKADEIPIEARVIAPTLDYARRVAAGLAPDKAATEVNAAGGGAFDPKVLEAFLLALRDEAKLKTLPSAGATEAGGTVLLADPDASALTLCEMQLTHAGFDVITCSDGLEAFTLIGERKPDVVIADMALPRLDGIALLLRLRRDKLLSTVPVLLTSTRSDPGMLSKALKLGAKDILPKPVDQGVLMAKLRMLSSRRRGKGSGPALNGSLAEIPLPDFFQTLQLGRKTVRVRVDSPKGKGEVYFRDGEPTAAFTPKSSGTNAFYRIVSFKEGTFEVDAGALSPKKNLDKGLHALLMAAACVLDEDLRES
jgi:DNA-binding response OmpR family regulator